MGIYSVGCDSGVKDFYTMENMEDRIEAIAQAVPEKKAWNCCKGQFRDPEIRARALAIQKANKQFAYKDIEGYLRKIFNNPKQGGSTSTRMVKALDKAIDQLSDRIAAGGLGQKELIEAMNSLWKAYEMLKKLNAPQKPQVAQQINVIMGERNTGGAAAPIVKIKDMIDESGEASAS